MIQLTEHAERQREAFIKAAVRMFEQKGAQKGWVWGSGVWEHVPTENEIRETIDQLLEVVDVELTRRGQPMTYATTGRLMVTVYRDTSGDRVIFSMILD